MNCRLPRKKETAAEPNVYTVSISGSSVDNDGFYLTQTTINGTVYQSAAELTVDPGTEIALRVQGDEPAYGEIYFNGEEIAKSFYVSTHSFAATGNVSIALSRNRARDSEREYHYGGVMNVTMTA